MPSSRACPKRSPAACATTSTPRTCCRRTASSAWTRSPRKRQRSGKSGRRCRASRRPSWFKSRHPCAPTHPRRAVDGFGRSRQGRRNPSRLIAGAGRACATRSHRAQLRACEAHCVRDTGAISVENRVGRRRAPGPLPGLSLLRNRRHGSTSGTRHGIGNPIGVILVVGAVETKAMRWDELPRSDNVEDRRADGGPRGMPMGRTRGIGIGTLGILCLIGWALGINPLDLIQGQIGSGTDDSQQQQTQPAPGREAQAPSDQMGQFVAAVLGSTEVQWKEIFAAAGKAYQAPTLVMFSGATRSACGFAQAAMGPFYCPNDRKVYLDTSFFQDLERRFRGCEAGSKGCQFSQAYVITHEIGHHVQNLLGILPKVQEMQRGLDQAEANQLQVRVELQADCLAGVWAHHAEEKWRLIEPGDVEAAMQTASAIGDDRLQRRSQGYVVPDAFTHGSSAQRTRWFVAGLKSGELASCDTFSAQQL